MTNVATKPMAPILTNPAVTEAAVEKPLAPIFLFEGIGRQMLNALPAGDAAAAATDAGAGDAAPDAVETKPAATTQAVAEANTAVGRALTEAITAAGSSASNTPSRAEIGERITQAKADLEKLESALSEAKELLARIEKTAITQERNLENLQKQFDEMRGE